MPTFLYNRLAAILLQEQLLLQEGPLNPAQMKTKLGIKSIAISDEDMQALMDITQDKKQLVTLVRFVLELKDIQLVKTYALKMMELDPKLDPQRFTTFMEFTNYIDAKVPKQTGSSFDLELQKADWYSQDGRYRVYKTEGRNDCIKYGHGQTFCISRIGSGNLYHHYRSVQQSNFYFVFDTSLEVDAETYITVVDAHPDGKFEFTQRSNNTPETSRNLGYDLDNFLRTKPGLSAAKAFFQPKPHTAEEKAEIIRWKEVAARGLFASLSREEKLRFIGNGAVVVHGKQLSGMDSKMQNEFVSVFGSRLFEPDLKYFDNKQQIRIVADLAEDMSLEYSADAIRVFEQNMDRFYFRLATRQEEPPKGQFLIKWLTTYNVLARLADPTPLLQRHSPEEWKQSFEYTLGKYTHRLIEFSLQCKNLGAIKAYIPSDVFTQGIEMAGASQLASFLKSPQRVADDVKRLSGEALNKLLVRRETAMEIIQVSPVAFDLLVALAAHKNIAVADCFKTVVAVGYYRAVDRAILNLILTSPDPKVTYEELPISGEDYIFNVLTLDQFITIGNNLGTDPKYAGFVRKLASDDMLPDDVFTERWWGRTDLAKQDSLFQVGQQIKKLIGEQPQEALVTEAYLARFTKILNS